MPAGARPTFAAMTYTPVRVAVTGAAGQIGYSLLFRIASGSMLGPDTPVDPPAARDHAGARRARGRAHGARRLRLPAARRRRLHRRRRRRVRRHRRRPARRRDAPQAGHGALGPAVGERRDLQAAGRGAVAQRQARRQGARRRQPGEHERADRPVQRHGPRSGAVHGDDPARPQPGHQPDRPEARRAGHRREEDDDLGNHSTTQYPDLFHAEVGGKNAYEAVGDHEWVDGRSSRPSPSGRGDHRGPRARRRRRPPPRRRRPHPLMGARHARR